MKHMTAVLFAMIAATGCASQGDGVAKQIICDDGATSCETDPRLAAMSSYIDELGVHDVDELTLVNATSAAEAQAIAGPASTLDPNVTGAQPNYYGCSVGVSHGACCWDQQGYVKCVGW